MKLLASTTLLLLALATPALSFTSERRTAFYTYGNSPRTSSSFSCRTTALASVPAAAIEPAKKILIAAAAALGSVIGSLALRGEGTKKMLDAIDESFPGTLTNQELAERVYDQLKSSVHGFSRENSLLCTCVARDSIALTLEKAFAGVFPEQFRLGGLAGFPWGGTMAFAEMASQIPNGGSVLIVFASHVGVDNDGTFGTTTVPRLDHHQQHQQGQHGVPCCAASISAAESIMENKEKIPIPESPLDAEQVFVRNALLPYADRLEQSADKMVELPYALYDAQKSMIEELIQKGCATAIPADCKIAVLGGIQISTPAPAKDYFLPLSFVIYNDQGVLLEVLTL